MKRIFCAVFSFVFLMMCAFQCQGEGALIASPENIVADKIVTVALGDEAVASTNALPVKIDAKSAILVEATSGKVMMEKNPDEKLYPASVTKIMTMLLVVEAIDSGKITLEDKVAASKYASSMGGTEIWLEEGEIMTVHELLKATAVGSANDAAMALGEYISGSKEAFVDAMNARAAELGMTNTHFDNPTGLDDTSETHLTTARDVALMSCALLRHKLIEEYTTIWMDTLRNGETELTNTNKLVRFYAGTTGLKTGTTAKAGNCVSASARRDGLHLVAVVMGSVSSAARWETAKAMLSWGFSNYTLVEPAVDPVQIAHVAVWYGEQNTIIPSVPELSPILTKKGKEAQVTTEITVAESVEAPVYEGQSLGKLKFVSNGQVVAEYDLTAPKDIKKLNVFSSFMRIFRFLATGTVNEA